MKKQFKKGLAVLAAGVLLTTSAAVYAAQLPGENTQEPLSSSSQVELDMDIRMNHYELTSDRIYAGFTVKPIGMRDIQFKTTTYNFRVEVENGSGSSNFETVMDGVVVGSPYSVVLDQPISIEKGERVHVTLEASAPAFLGYSIIGTASGTRDYYFTLE